jgi:AmmeMemoRadiSam system protein B
LEKESEFVRAPAVAGLFYPAGQNELRESVEELLEAARRNVAGTVLGKIAAIISPHAGYLYSGYTAAHGYSLLSKNQFKTVVVVSPSHREYFEGLSVFSGKAYSTPLGELRVDNTVREMFMNLAGKIAVESRIGHGTEHAIEVQLPFLQAALGEFQLVPVVMGDQRPEYCKTLGFVLSEIAKEHDLLLVASSDLSHYYDYDTANVLDQLCISDIGKLDPDKLMDDIEYRRCEACGGGPIASCLYAARELGLGTVAVLHHCNSGDATEDKSRVVGYLSAVIS